MKKTVYIVLLLFFTGILCYSAWNLLDILGSYREGEDSYHDLEQYVSFEEPAAEKPTQAPIAEKPTQPPVAESEPAESTETTRPEETQPEPTEPIDLSGWPQVDFEQLAQINPDVVGWIYIKDTNINYPIVQGENNDYYLKRLFDGTYNSAGCIFLDAACKSDFSGKHSIIYGHHMKNQTMFADLMKYKNQIFFEEHPEGMLITPTAYYRIRFFSGYVSNNWTDAWKLSFHDDSYGDWLSSIQRRSYFETTDQPGEDDRVVTLSTCTYEFDNAKYVLHGYISEVIELPDSGR